mmetsp:Transcript_30681/g.89603  ORF Transcript_30681/g.89603 Transcript_30681/m.89603 type:complete len:299 (-) Transcript_30681:1101-1997(-)
MSFTLYAYPLAKAPSKYHSNIARLFSRQKLKLYHGIDLGICQTRYGKQTNFKLVAPVCSAGLCLFDTNVLDGLYLIGSQRFEKFEVGIGLVGVGSVTECFIFLVDTVGATDRSDFSAIILLTIIITFVFVVRLLISTIVIVILSTVVVSVHVLVLISIFAFVNCILVLAVNVVAGILCVIPIGVFNISFLVILLLVRTLVFVRCLRIIFICILIAIIVRLLISNPFFLLTWEHILYIFFILRLRLLAMNCAGRSARSIGRDKGSHSRCFPGRWLGTNIHVAAIHGCAPRKVFACRCRC